MLWLALHLPQLSLEALGGVQASPVVTERRGARRWVIAGAADLIEPGTDWGAVQLLHPELRAIERKPRAEREAMQALAAWAYRYGSELIWDIAESEVEYGLPRPMLWIEIGNSLRLFGGLDALIADFDAAFAETGHRGQRGVAPTIEAAALLAQAGVERPVTERTQLASVLGDMLLQALALSPSILEALKNIGLSRIGELLALPADAIGRRHGPKLVDHLDRLLGRRPDVRPRYRLPPKYSRRFDLLGEVEHSEGLLFPLQRLIRELAEYLRARDTGVQEFRLSLNHGRASRGKSQPDSIFELRLATPCRDAERLLRVLREQLACRPLPAPVHALRLQAERFVDPSPGQGDLFDASRHDDEAWSQLLEKLSARLGSEAVTALGLFSDHRPERCWKTQAFGTPMRDSASILAALPARPIWLIDPPKPLHSAPKLLNAAERMERMERMERIEGGWWDGSDISRDYYRTDLHGSRLWVFQDRNTSAWYLQGVWA